MVNDVIQRNTQYAAGAAGVRKPLNVLLNPLQARWKE
jgi:hypothetical protein